MKDTPTDPVRLQLERDALGSFAAVSSREWLVTNGIGGYASGTVGGANTRRYHGLLVSALHPPLGRTVMVAGLEVFAIGAERIALSTQEYVGGTVAPEGYRHLLSFHLDGQIPVWTWLVGDALLEQRVWMEYGHNTTYVQWTLVRGRSISLDVQPLCTWRDYHWQHRGRRDPQLHFDASSVQVVAFDGAAPYRIIAEQGQCQPDLDWYWNFHHRIEAERGLDAEEDLFRTATIRFDLKLGESRALILTSELQAPTSAADSRLHAEQRQETLLRAARRATPAMSDADARMLAPLVLAADQFIVARKSTTSKQNGLSIIAGYPWFGDWGRDTMIALPGLTLTTGRTREAADILRTFARHVSEGMLPNRFPDDGETPEYNTVDATLWYFVAIHQYLQHTGDVALRTELYPVLQNIVDWHLRGTRYGIGVDAADGLLKAGVPGAQLTWMDAKIGDWVVTPRIGKPAEINALWINALRIMSRLAREDNKHEDSARLTALADQATTSFQIRFWNEASGCLFDVIDTPNGTDDASIRPNQLFTLSLPFPLFEGQQAKAIVDVCLRELWTPVGLRSLAPRDAAYIGRYAGGPLARDAAYHQGTVWSWLLGPFAIAHFRAHGDRAAARGLLSGLLPHLREACIGQISEIFDGDAPFAPAGCVAQAWSVAETLRAWSELNEISSTSR